MSDDDDITTDASTESGLDPRYVVPGLTRGLKILQLLNTRQRDMTLAEIADAIGLSRSSTFRLLYTLEGAEFLSRDPVQKRYALSSRVLSLGYSYLAAQPLVEKVYPYLRRISLATGLTAHLVELDGVDAVYIARVAPTARFVSNLQIGTRLPAHRTVSGRVLLSGIDPEILPEVHARLTALDPDTPPPPLEVFRERVHADEKRGYVFAESTFDPGIESFAAPVRDGAGRVIGAINALGQSRTVRALGGVAELDAIIGANARELSRQLGWAG
ncbi:MAG: IclR family transcriptional regulator [Rhodobacter sp.]|nr:IclR family transcriptional regulator [Paracoccaceae bacterium]MCC0077258.1 IclR family transcriptional regulator [Rhodobacter sp.]